jgi:hypothetical protein
MLHAKGTAATMSNTLDPMHIILPIVEIVHPLSRITVATKEMTRPMTRAVADTTAHCNSASAGGGDSGGSAMRTVSTNRSIRFAAGAVREYRVPAQVSVSQESQRNMDWEFPVDSRLEGIQKMHHVGVFGIVVVTCWIEQFGQDLAL